MGGLGGQRTPSLASHLLQGVAEAGRNSRRDGALGQRRLAQQHALAPLLGQEVERHLRRQHGAAEVHQDQHAVGRPRLADGARHENGVGTQRLARLVETAGDRDPHFVRAHLRGEFSHTLGKLRAVADQHQSDHGTAPRRFSPASVSAAVCSSSHDDVAPGSWWPALRSPR